MRPADSRFAPFCQLCGSGSTLTGDTGSETLTMLFGHKSAPVGENNISSALTKRKKYKIGSCKDIWNNCKKKEGADSTLPTTGLKGKSLIRLWKWNQPMSHEQNGRIRIPYSQYRPKLNPYPLKSQVITGSDFKLHDWQGRIWAGS